ncbi:glycosyltransferase family 2 protein [Salirhabdus salicampi]|uniref:glycosyltransferase family 2 protein n=1 Tax=Salirhabdus salicampi TaxID=476102 RepID=UPI0020C3F4AC|nr:glycosyltransferase family 2 protein [Salirhabdus salicampi]MCP8617501.1 glycosyltransferase family 2 protein [Salirhabdus salicampi]
MDSLLDLIIINYNTKELSDKCITRLMELGLHKKFGIYYIDNDSSDGSYEFINEKYGQHITVVQNKENRGYSYAANQGIELSSSRYVMILNTDIWMGDNFISTCLEYLEEHGNVGAVTGKLLKYDFDQMCSVNVIDSTGIAVYKNMRMVDRGQNEADIDKYNDSIHVFGVSGAAPIYRREALDDIKLNDEYFDNDFFAYKEDIDLSWRLRTYGWECHYVPDAITYHGRAIGQPQKLKFLIKHRNTQSDFIKKLSFINSYLILIKNANVKNVINAMPREVIKLFYILLFEPRLLSTIPEIFRKSKIMLKKRKAIKQHAKNRDSKLMLH